MTWSSELDELRRRQEFAEQMGGAEGIDRQHRNGKLTVRERLPLLADPGSFQQFNSLRGEARYDDAGGLVGVLPDGKVEGMCRVEGRKVVVTAGDFTVRGGSASGQTGGLGNELTATERALEWRLPLVRLLDAAGGSVRSFETLGRTYLPDANSFTHIDIKLLSTVPVVSAVLGAAAGIGALHTSLAHWNVMVRDTGQVFPGGPPVVKAALGEDMTKEDLGRLADPHAGERRGRQPGRRRGGRLPPDPAVPVVPAVERGRDGAARGARRPARSARGGPGHARAEGPAEGARRPAPHRAGGRRAARSSRSRRGTAGPASPGWHGSTATRSG